MAGLLNRLYPEDIRVFFLETWPNLLLHADS